MAVKRSQKTRKTARRSTKERKRIVKPSSLKHDGDFGKLTLRKHVNANRKANQEEIKEYEKKYLARYKEPKGTPKKKKSYSYIIEKTKQEVKKERKDYEKEYLTRYRKQQKANPKKKILAIR